ncbi:MAG TPA: response regulator [Candidatus Acidoferrales bacterium]|jgi:DNA-binding NtrC family response regulator|nr:response regulator [Candidatus Acidoferrales bacterium]
MSDTKIINANAETILVVEDEVLLREIECSILESCGYRVLEADSSSKAMDVWNQQGEKIDLLLTDVVLPPGISGMELAKRLRDRQPRLKVIFTTGKVDLQLDDATLERMNARFLQKPYQHTDLVQLVDDALTPAAA